MSTILITGRWSLLISREPSVPHSPDSPILLFISSYLLRLCAVDDHAITPMENPQTNTPRRRRYIKLPVRQRKLLSVILAGYALLILNSLILMAFNTSTAFVYMTNVLVHVAIGVLIVPPVIVFLILHLMRMPLLLNKAATAVGSITAFTLGVVLLSGFGIIIWGASALGGLLLTVHICSAAGAVLAFATHVSLKHGVRYHFLEFRDAWNGGAMNALRHPFGMTLAGGLIVSLVALAPTLRPRDVYVAGEEDIHGLHSSRATLAHDSWLSVDDLSRSDTCGQAGCHPDVFAQWSESVHRFSSFNNPYYARTVDYMMSRSGAAPTRWCASCHDPVVLFSGRFGNEMPLDTTHWSAKEGLTCLSCHAIRGVKDITGNGGYVIGMPDEYPFARAEGSPGADIHYKLIQIKPEPHAQAMLAPALQTEVFCSSCHKVALEPDVNNYRWKRGQNEWDDWHASGASGNTVRSFYLPPQPKTCIDCHMPLVPSDDRGNENGFIRSHRFVAANSAIPFLNEHAEQMRLVQNFLSDSIATVDIFRVSVGGRTYAGDEAMPALQPGQEVVVDVVVRNRKVGHKLPGGTNDSNEMWLELNASDSDGDVLLASGSLDAAGRVDSSAHFWGGMLVDRGSRMINKRNAQDWVATTYAHTIGPGTANVVHYRFRVPAGQPITSLKASLKHRKFKWYYNNWVFRGYVPEGQPDSLVSLEVDRREWALDDSEAPDLPITTMATSERTAGDIPDARVGLWERWNDLGIGYLLEGDTKRAVEAFRKVAEVAPENPEGAINLARAYLSEGQLDRALEALEEAEACRPGYLKTTYFRGAYHQARGDYDAALSEWMKVYADYPLDRVLLLGIGRLHYLSGRYDQALKWFDELLVVDPEDLGGLYNRMLTLGALERTEDFEAARKVYEYHKDDERAMAVTRAHKLSDPILNREAQPVHEHGLSRDL